MRPKEIKIILTILEKIQWGIFLLEHYIVLSLIATVPIDSEELDSNGDIGIDASEGDDS